MTNEEKIRFCNAYDAVTAHRAFCNQCDTYLRGGDGDLCYTCKDTISKEMLFGTVPERPTSKCNEVECDGDIVCRAQPEGSTLECTRPPHHAGDHIACGTARHNMRVWPNNPQPVRLK